LGHFVQAESFLIDGQVSEGIASIKKAIAYTPFLPLRRYFAVFRHLLSANLAGAFRNSHFRSVRTAPDSGGERVRDPARMCPASDHADVAGMRRSRRHRVLYVNPAASAEDQGPAQHAHAVARHLTLHGVEVSVFPTFVDGTGEIVALEWDFLSTVKRMTRRILPFEFVSFLRGIGRTAILLLGLYLESRRHGATVILARHYDYDWLPWLAAKMLRLPLVLEVNSPFYLERKLHGRRSPTVLRWMEQVQWRRADALYVVSEELGQILEQRDGVAANRIHVVPNGVELTDFPDPARSSNPLVRVIFSGGFYRWHGVCELVRAFAAAMVIAPVMRLELVGDGPEFDAVIELVSSLGIDEFVDLKGRLGRKALVERLYAADIAVAPYQVETDFYFSPLKLMEYMAAGLSVVAPAQGQLRSIISDGEDGMLYPPRDMDALRDRLVELASNPALRRKLSRAARKKAESELGWDLAASKLVRILDGVGVEAEVMS
jgi:glycosyltransferase involved in cell wall biosynthesis